MLTGLGRDGTQGGAHINAAGGTVLAQEPSTAVMPFMPQTAIETGVAKVVAPLEGISDAIKRKVEELDGWLERARVRAS